MQYTQLKVSRLQIESRQDAAPSPPRAYLGRAQPWSFESWEKSPFHEKSMVYPTFFFGIQPSQVDFHRRSSKKLAMFIDFPELNNQKGVPSPMDVASQAAFHGCLVHLTSGGARRGCNLANWDQCWREERIGNMFENDTYVHIYIHIHIHIIYICWFAIGADCVK